MAKPHRKLSPIRLIGLAAVVVLVVAMTLSTKFLTPEELAAIGPVKFDPVKTANDLHARAKAELPGKAKPLTEVLPAVQDDPAKAAEQFGAVVPTEGTYVFPVTATGTVNEVTATGLRLQLTGYSGRTPILVPLGTAINGTVLRDAMNFRFADAPGQTEYQYVGDELKKLMQAEVAAGISDPSSVQGKKVDVVGVVSVVSAGGGPPPDAKPVNIQPLTIKVGA